MTAMRLPLDASVRCGEDAVGTLGDVVIDPAARRLTHLVVETGPSDARLVPIGLLEHRGGVRRDVLLTCTAAELGRLTAVREYAYLPVDQLPQGDEDSDVGVEDVTTMPYYDVTEFGDYAGEFDSNTGVTFDRIPKGDVELRHASDVYTRSGDHLGHLAALLVDDDRITHVVLTRGHFWRKRDVRIPIDVVAKIETDTVTVELSKEEVAELPTLSPRRPSL